MAGYGSGGVRGLSYGAKVMAVPRRFSMFKCRDCGKMVPHKIADQECFCGPCRDAALKGITVYQRGGGVLPANLARSYGGKP